MPVDNRVYHMMLDEFKDFDPDYSVKCIEANRHNQITATYHLMSKKHSGKQSSTSRQGQQTQSLPPYKPQQDKYATVAASVTAQKNPE